MPLPTISEIAKALETWAPPGSAQSYDNVGLQVGDGSRPVQRALIALDLTPAVIEEAHQHDATLIITHHPLIFKPLPTLTPDGFVSGLALRLAEAGIALYSIHTNLDAAPGGVSFALAEHLGLHDVRFLDTFGESLYKLATFVPPSHLDVVREALEQAGASQSRVYEAVATASPLRDFSRPGETAPPGTGTTRGDRASVVEIKLEVEVARWDLSRIVRALKAAHPYEEVSYDVYPVEQPNTQVGLGAVGRLAAPMPLAAFLAHVTERLQAGSLRYVGNPETTVETVAVCGGSGSSFTRHALHAGADAYVTADVTYHKFFEVLDLDGQPRMALIDAGHYETEALTERLLQDWLGARFPAVAWQRTATRTSPMETFIPAQ